MSKYVNCFFFTFVKYIEYFDSIFSQNICHQSVHTLNSLSHAECSTSEQKWGNIGYSITLTDTNSIPWAVRYSYLVLVIWKTAIKITLPSKSLSQRIFHVLQYLKSALHDSVLLLVTVMELSVYWYKFWENILVSEVMIFIFTRPINILSSFLLKKLVNTWTLNKMACV